MSHGICSFGPISSVQVAAALRVKRLLISPVTAGSGGKCSSVPRTLAGDLQSSLRKVVRSPVLARDLQGILGNVVLIPDYWQGSRLGKVV